MIRGDINQGFRAKLESGKPQPSGCFADDCGRWVTPWIFYNSPVCRFYFPSRFLNLENALRITFIRDRPRQIRHAYTGEVSSLGRVPKTAIIVIISTVKRLKARKCVRFSVHDILPVSSWKNE